MQISELAHRANTTVKAVRYYEQLGLITPERLDNGYRDYDEAHLRAIREIRDLTGIGIPARATAPFVECLDLGHPHGDDCVSSLASYRDSIRELDRLLELLHDRRARLVARLNDSAERGFIQEEHMNGYAGIPDDLPVPTDDGAADHLPGMRMPTIALPTSDGGSVDMADLGDGRTILYLYPLTGRPGVDLPEGWDAIPGARGCTTEACDFRDHHDDLRAAGAARVWGLSSQSTDYQAEVVERLRLPFVMLSDAGFRLADALLLPTFAAPGHPRLYSRLTLVIRDSVVEHVFYPIFPPNEHARQVLEWLAGHPLDAD
jgi:peroxiredoxin/DNA-binding transcriptional MerR regulator